jgi:hypothetical protein
LCATVRISILLQTMSQPPLPEVPCVRINIDYVDTDGYLAGSRFFMSYTGTSPSPGDCQSLAANVATAWGDHLAPGISSSWSIAEVDVLDIASYSGSSGQSTQTETGQISGTPIPAQSCVNIEFGIARRYRGGKPRMFMPGPTDAYLANSSTFTTAYIDSINTGMSDFMSLIASVPVGNMGSLQHVNISFYQGFKNVTNTSGRTRAAPTYRTVALVDPVESYITKQVLGSQRRRRTSTTY